MIELPFERIAPEYIRIGTQEVVANDLAVRVNDSWVYDPAEDRNAMTSMRFTEPVPEGATVYVAARKAFGIAYRLSPWEAAIGLRGRVLTVGGGYATENVTADSGYYPMGEFVAPTAIVVNLTELVPGVPKKLVAQFASGALESQVWVPQDEQEVREFVHARRDQVKKMLLLEMDEELPGLQ